MTGALLALALLLVPHAHDSTLARADSLITRGELDPAREILESYLTDHPNDPRALTLLGRVYLAWPVVGRYKAWHLFERAADLAPTDLAPRYGQMQVGLYLGGDDGEGLARDAIFHILEHTPDYRDVWSVWRRLYESRGDVEHAVRLLARFHGPPADERRAEALIRLEAYDSAEALLGRVITTGRDDAAVWALRAQAAYQRGDATDGRVYYQRAIARAATDTAKYLWLQVEAIASPDEMAEFAVTPPDSLSAFYRGFWARRDPDLTTTVNERIAEHFRRLREAREQFHILHPESMFHRSRLYRTLQGAVSGAVYQTTKDVRGGSDILPGRSVFEDRVAEAGLGVDVRDLPEPDSITRYATYGFDGRGLIYLRFGRPARRYISSGALSDDVEAWTYRVDGREVTLTFARATNTASFSGGALLSGDFVIYPTTQRELHNAGVMLEEDASSLAAPFPLVAWEAVFRDSVGSQIVYVQTNTDSAGAAAWRKDGTDAARAVGATPLELHLPPGRYAFGVDAHAEGTLGRIRGELPVPSLAPGWLAVSSLLVGVTTDSVPDRRTMLHTMLPSLDIVRHGAPLSLYTEVYDLPADSDGVAHYELTYTFEPIGRNARPITFAFTRAARAMPTMIERLGVQPGAVPPGRYRLMLTVRDLVLALPPVHVHIDVTLH